MSLWRKLVSWLVITAEVTQDNDEQRLQVLRTQYEIEVQLQALTVQALARQRRVASEGRHEPTTNR